MRKLISLLLALTMVFSLATVAFAAETETTKVAASKAATYTAIVKTYTVNGATDETLYPTETLKFVSNAATTNPDGGAANLTINELTVAGNSNQTLTINVPSFSKVGTYHFTITETAGSAQGVTYTKGDINISVLVTYDYEDTDNDGYTMTATVGVTNEGTDSAESKTDALTNIYDVGSLAITKSVTGNLGDTSKYFDVTVTFTAEANKTVESAITITGGSNSENPTVIEYDWTGTKSVVIKVKNGDTVTFNNIPAGVTYTVVEANYTEGDKNSENGYDAAKYEFSDATKAIASKDADTVKITNNKDQGVDTGIITDSAPYILLIAVCAVVAVLFVTKRRAVEF